ncbi:MAG: hypothetical protein V2A69_02140 [Pseudomonadota bacterium]
MTKFIDFRVKSSNIASEVAISSVAIIQQVFPLVGCESFQIVTNHKVFGETKEKYYSLAEG